MLEKFDGPTKVVISILAFPMFFQEPMLAFAWGVGDDFLIAMAKRLLILLPSLAIVFSCWLTILCVVSLIFRQKRREFVSSVFVTWWDLGRSIFAFWGGIFKFLFVFIGVVFGFIRVLVFGLLLMVKDILLLPVRLMSDMGRGYFVPGVPWPAVGMMLGWALLEALIFTFVMTPLVKDVLSGIAGQELEGPILQVPLYLMFLIFVLGSYAVIESFGKALKEREVNKIIIYAMIEVIVALVETVFLYREFVDALVPWFAQHAGDDFELGLWTWSCFYFN